MQGDAEAAPGDLETVPESTEEVDTQQHTSGTLNGIPEHADVRDGSSLPAVDGLADVPLDVGQCNPDGLADVPLDPPVKPPDATSSSPSDSPRNQEPQCQSDTPPPAAASQPTLQPALSTVLSLTSNALTALSTTVPVVLQTVGAPASPRGAPGALTGIDGERFDQQMRGVERELRRLHSMGSNVGSGAPITGGMPGGQGPSTWHLRRAAEGSEAAPAPGRAALAGLSLESDAPCTMQQLQSTDDPHLLAKVWESRCHTEAFLRAHNSTNGMLSTELLQKIHVHTLDHMSCCCSCTPPTKRGYYTLRPPTPTDAQVLLCDKVYPCLVASAAAYYQPSSFPSYTGIEQTAWYYDPVYSTMVRVNTQFLASRVGLWNKRVA